MLIKQDSKEKSSYLVDTLFILLGFMDLKGSKDTHGQDSVNRELLREMERHPCHTADPIQIRNLQKNEKKSVGIGGMVNYTKLFFFSRI